VYASRPVAASRGVAWEFRGVEPPRSRTPPREPERPRHRRAGDARPRDGPRLRALDARPRHRPAGAFAGVDLGAATGAVTAATLGVVVTAGSALFGLGALPGGLLVDRVGMAGSSVLPLAPGPVTVALVLAVPALLAGARATRARFDGTDAGRRGDGGGSRAAAGADSGTGRSNGLGRRRPTYGWRLGGSRGPERPRALRPPGPAARFGRSLRAPRPVFASSGRRGEHGPVRSPPGRSDPRPVVDVGPTGGHERGSRWRRRDPIREDRVSTGRDAHPDRPTARRRPG
jgi:hypothetical protein